jgi:hypothetical protein
MPPSRAEAIVVCSCGWRAGNATRGALDEAIEEVERTMLATQVPRMVRHWELDHTLTLQDRRYAGVVAMAAERLKERRERGIEPEPEDTGDET